MRHLGPALIRFAVGLLVAAVLAGCSGDTEPGSTVDHQSGKARGVWRVESGDGPGKWWFRYRRTGTSTWTETLRQDYGRFTQAQTIPVDVTIAGLQAGTTYEYELCGYGDKRSPSTISCFDVNGDSSGPKDTFATSSSHPTVTPRAAQALRDAIGVNIRHAYTDTAYNNVGTLRNALTYTGIRHIRDGLWFNRPDLAQRLKDIASDGVKITLGLGGLRECMQGDYPVQVQALRNDAVLRAAVDSIDSMNEPEVAFPGYTPPADWPQRVRTCQQDLYQRIKGAPELAHLPVLGPSFASLSAAQQVGNLSQWLDFGNSHPYPGDGRPGLALDEQPTRCSVTAGSKQCQFTETGYHTAAIPDGVNEQVKATYTLRMALEHFRRGVRRTDFYQLVDQPCGGPTDRESNFGFYDCGWNAKLVAHALHNLTTAVETGTPTLTPLQLAVEQAPTDLRQTLLRQADGDYLLALWRDVDVWNRSANQPQIVAPANVRVSLPTATNVAKVLPVNSATEQPVVHGVHTSVPRPPDGYHRRGGHSFLLKGLPGV